MGSQARSRLETASTKPTYSIIMPGHQKKAKPGEVDPDPLPFLVVTLEMKREFMQKPYDAKKSFWCPDGKGGFAECMLEEDDGTKAKSWLEDLRKKFSSLRRLV